MGRGANSVYPRSAYSNPMITLWCRQRSTGARLLVESLVGSGHPAQRTGQLNQVVPGLVVNWGSHGTPAGPGLVVLNSRLIPDKLAELQRLSEGGIRVPRFRTGRPETAGWLARTLHHQEARDLLAGLTVGDYWTEYTPTTHEFRVHIFDQRVIRVGLKVPRTANPHPRFRSWNAGWKFSYGTDCQALVTNPIRQLGRDVLRTVGYDFGAVDIGVDPAGHSLVFEVNSAPGIEGGTVRAYADAILRRL